MTTEEAFELTLKTVAELQTTGIEVKVKPSKSKDNKELIQKHNGLDHISPDKWCHINFFPKNNEQSGLIHIKAKELGWLGIGFDTGGCLGQRDWKLDWSFHYTGKQDDNMEAGRDWVEKTIRNEIEESTI